MRRRILMPLPDRDFDVTEVAVPWRLLTDAGHDVVFATERGGAPPQADPLLLTGVLFGQLGAEPVPKAYYRDLERSPEFLVPVCWEQVSAADFDGLLLPGGHAQGMRQYLDSASLRSTIADFCALDRAIGAICHGVLALARARDTRTGRSVIAGRRTTCLPKFMERTAYLITAWKLGRYYRTYPAYVEDEVKGVLDDPANQFVRGPFTLTTRGTAESDHGAFVVEDGPYVSARWPGDAYLFARRFRALVESPASARTKSVSGDRP